MKVYLVQSVFGPTKIEKITGYVVCEKHLLMWREALGVFGPKRVFVITPSSLKHLSCEICDEGK